MAKVAPLGSYLFGKSGQQPQMQQMQMPAWAPATSAQPYVVRAQPTTLSAAAGGPVPQQTASDYLVGLSRKTQRGQEFAQTVDSVHAMIKELGTTNDPARRQAIVAALKGSGIIGGGK